MRQMMSQQRLWNQLEGFTHQIHGSLDLKETAYAVVNDGKRLVGCDRLSVALKIAGRTMVEAVSGQEVVEQRSNLVRELTRLCKVVIRSGEDLVYTGNTEGFAPDIRDALEMYVDESGSKVVVITLLHKPETEQGAREQGEGAVRLPGRRADRRRAGADRHARPDRGRLAARLDGALERAGTPQDLPEAGAEGDGLALADVPGPDAGQDRRGAGRRARVRARAWRSSPARSRSRATARCCPRSGTRSTRRWPGSSPRCPSTTASGCRRETSSSSSTARSLQKELKGLIAEQAEGREPGRVAGRAGHRSCARARTTQDLLQIQAQRAEAKITAKSAKERIEIVEEQIESMNIRSPQDGIITTWEAKKNLMGRPVEIGTELLQIAATDGEWILEVEVPDDDMGPILAAQSQLEADIKAGRKKPGTTLPAYFVTMTDPEHRYHGYVIRIAPNAETMAESEQYKNRHVVKVTVGFSETVRQDYLARNQIKEMRPGAEVRARVDCGRTNLAYYLLRKPIQVFYESVLFRWPFLH